MEDCVNRAFIVVFGPNTKLEHAENEHNKIQFMTGTIVDAFKRSERLLQVDADFGNAVNEVFRVFSEAFYVVFESFFHFLNKSLESLVTEAHRLFYCGDIIKHDNEFVKPGNYGLTILTKRD